MAKPNSISSPTWGDVLTGERGRRLLALLSIIVLHAGGNYMTVTMAASMIAELGDGALVGALTALYNIATILAAAATGILGDRFGLTRWLWMMALAFAGGALLSAIAPTMSLVALGRALSGLGGGGLFALAFIALRHHSSTAAWPKIIAFSGVFWIGAAFTGPLLGGVLADSLGWRGAFLLSGLFALGYAVMCRNAIASAGRQSQADQPAARERFPVWRLVGFGLGVAAISFAPLVSHPVAMVASTVIGFAAILYAAMRDRARPPRLFPRNAFRLGTDQGRALLAKLVLASGSMSILVFGPLVLASVHGYSNTFAGGFILLETVAWSFASFFVASLSPQRAERVAAFGSGLAVLGLIGAYLTLVGGSMPADLFGAGASIMVCGLGLGLAWPILSQKIVAPSQEDESNYTPDPSDDENAKTLSTAASAETLGFAIGAALMGVAAALAAGPVIETAESIRVAAKAATLCAIPITLAGATLALFTLWPRATER